MEKSTINHRGGKFDATAHMILSAFTLSTAMTLGPRLWPLICRRKGRIAGRIPAVGTFKATRSGKSGCCRLRRKRPDGRQRVPRSHDMALLRLIRLTSGMGRSSGYCAATDPDGDQIAANFDGDEIRQPAAKTISVMGKFTTGTGKYAGISGGHYVYTAQRCVPVGGRTLRQLRHVRGQLQTPMTSG